MGKLKLPFELEKPSNNEFVTQASEVGMGGQSVKAVIDAMPSTVDADEDEGFCIADSLGWVIARLIGGEINTRNFSSALSPQVFQDESNDSLCIADPNGYVLAVFTNGHIKTKNFDSSNIDSGGGAGTVVSDSFFSYTKIY